MVDDSSGDREFVLSALPASPAERRFAAVVALSSFGILLVAAPFASVPLARIPSFIAVYETALVVGDLITAVLLFGQFAAARSRALLVLAGGYLFTALMTVAHALSFPGLFSEGGLLGAGTQSTAWLYMFWHSGFPAAVLGYALLKKSSADQPRPAVLPAVLASVITVAAIALLLTSLATAGEPFLPRIMRGDGYTPAMIFVIAAVWLLCLLALLILLLRQPHSVLDLWLMAVLCAWLCDVALSAVLNSGRFDLGFYLGRAYGLLAANLILLALLLQTMALYGRLARALQAERQERERRLGELRSELLHVSRLSELGQMVSALAHEVRQPLTAVANYINAGRRFVQAAQAEQAQAALGRAVGEVNRAQTIVERLGDFTKKKESERRAENLNGTIEEAIALALVGAEGFSRAVELRLDPVAPLVFIDKIEIQQVLLNLARNAIEAMAEGPRRRLVIAVTTAADDMLEVSIADVGPGLAPEVRQKLFQPFVTTKSTGMGLGLSICREIIEAHGGRIWVEDNPGGGTVFRFTLPRAREGKGQSAA